MKQLMEWFLELPRRWQLVNSLGLIGLGVIGGVPTSKGAIACVVFGLLGLGIWGFAD